MARQLMKYIEASGITNPELLAAKIKEDLGIKTKIYEEEELMVFNYCQIDSPKTHPVVVQCRGTILSFANNSWKIVCRPFDRFFNFGEALEQTGDFNLEGCVAYEKVDGSLVKVYHWNGLWRIATRGTAFAESENYTGQTFLDMILETLGCSSLEDFSEKFSRAARKTTDTYLFEFISPHNRVVTPYEKSELVLLGWVEKEPALGTMEYNQWAFEYLTLDYLAHSLVMHLDNVRATKVFDTSSVKEKHELMDMVSGLEEGFVCEDFDNKIRVKIKSDAYVAVHKIRGDTIPTPKRIMSLVVENEQEEYLTYFEEDASLFEPYEEWLEKMFLDMSVAIINYSMIESQKDFALAVKDLTFKPLLFTARKNGTFPTNEFKKLDNKQKVKYLTQYIEAQEGAVKNDNNA